MPKRRHPNQRPAGIQVTLANEQSRHPVDEEKLIEAVQAVVDDSRFTSASISIAIIDDGTMHDLNRRYLEHDYPTDVLSFVLEEDNEHLEGEVIASADMASAVADDLGVSLDEELLLYVIHGSLHLAGFRDNSPEEIAEMRGAEEKYMRRLGSSQARASSGRKAPAGMYLDGSLDQGDSGQ